MESVPASVNVAAVQLSSGSDVEHNVAAAIELVHEAAMGGATYVQLPEYFNYLGPSLGFEAARESIPGPTTTRMSDLAKSLSITLHLGSLLEAIPDSTRSFNTSVLLGPNGTIIATYRKAHLFDVDVPGQIVHRESDDVAPGQEMIVARVASMNLGMTICFDVRFPELYRALAMNGADVIAIPAAFNAATGRAHWEILLRSRAIENHAFVVSAAQVGRTSEGIATFGHSMIIDPWGTVLAESSHDGPDVIRATLDLAEVGRRRSQIAVLGLRRPDLYDGVVRRIEP
jgi:predicted amidohydrolase